MCATGYNDGAQQQQNTCQSYHQYQPIHEQYHPYYHPQSFQSQAVRTLEQNESHIQNGHDYYQSNRHRTTATTTTTAKTSEDQSQVEDLCGYTNGVSESTTKDDTRAGESNISPRNIDSWLDIGNREESRGVDMQRAHKDMDGNEDEEQDASRSSIGQAEENEQATESEIDKDEQDEGEEQPSTSGSNGDYRDPLAQLISSTIGDLILDIAPQNSAAKSDNLTTTTTTSRTE